MQGYHYTTHEAWQEISETGLVPKPIHEPTTWGPIDVDGIWVLTGPVTPLSHVGMLISQLARSRQTRLVCLGVEFDPERTYHHRIGRLPPDCTVQLTRELRLNEWILHQGHPAVILTEPVPRENIRLLEDVDLLDRLALPAGCFGEETKMPEVFRDFLRTIPPL